VALVGTTYAALGQVLAEHAITDGFKDVYFSGNNGTVVGNGGVYYALLEDEYHGEAAVVIEPEHGYSGRGRVYVSGCYYMFTDGNIDLYGNGTLWENIVQWALPRLCPGDLDGDGVRDLSDFTLFATAFGTTLGDPEYNPAADMDGDGVIDLSDFTVFASNYGVPCP
jgi:hypothetical protein